MSVIYRLLLLAFFTCCSNISIAQDGFIIEGVVLHSETKTAIPYAYVKKKGTNKGAITNEDGVFKLRCEETDTLIISFVSFNKAILPATYFLESKTYYLKPADNELAAVQVYANFDFLYDVFERARAKLKRVPNASGKTYFTLESSTNKQPVEMLECYYNSTTGHNGIKKMGLKNGRVGMALIDNTFYASLNSTYIISSYDLFTAKGNRFPDNPIHLKKRKLKKKYKLKLIAFANDTYKLSFKPKDATKQLFEAYVYINKTTERILKISLSKSDLKRHPFMGIQEEHKIKDINFSMDYVFTDTVDQQLEKLEVTYDLFYDNGANYRKMETKGVFLFYDYERQFNLPHYSETGQELSDYDQVVFQPYNAKFWSYNEVLSPSLKVLRYRDFFTKNGVMLNFDELEKHHETVFQNRIIPWSEEPVYSADINSSAGYNYGVSVTSLRDYEVLKTTPVSSQFNLVGHIYLDRNEFGDSTHYLSQTLIDRSKSYSLIKKNLNSLVVINIYYDIIEIERRQMMSLLNSHSWTNHEADSIYYTSQNRLNRQLRSFLTKSDYGKEVNVIKAYCAKINSELGVNNELLILNEKFLARDENDIPLYNPEFIELYSYAEALSVTGELEKAIGLLLKAHNMGAKDAWIYYQIGCNYLALDKNEDACMYLIKSREMGYDVEAVKLQHCE